MNFLRKISLNEAKGQSVDHLNLIRGIAALVVLVHHTRQQFFYDLDQLKNPSLFEKGFYFFTAFGQEAVRIFFVLSGFFIGLSVLKAIKSGRWSWHSYLTSRLTRLLLVLYPALLLCAFWDKTGISLFGTQSYGSNSLRFTLENALGNAVFLQRIIVEPFGTNDPLWSLSYEFWYYLLFPLGLFVILPNSSIKKRIFYGFMFVGIAYFVGLQIMLSFLIWLTGAAIAVIPTFKFFSNSKTKLKLAVMLSFTLLAGFLAISRAKRLGLEFNWVAILTALTAASTIYFILQLGNYRNNNSNSLYSRIAKSLAGCSYTLYLLHTPVLVFLSVWIYRETGTKWIPDLSSISLSFIVMIVVFSYALFVAHFTEARTDEVRRWVSNRFDRNSKMTVSKDSIVITEIASEKMKV